MNKIVGDFTLSKRAAGFKNVLMVGTGTGLAPFASMVKQLQCEALEGKSSDIRYTLLHANRSLEELGYNQELIEMESRHKFDFVYLPSISRPTARDLEDPTIGKGRANNILRMLFDLPTKEELTQESTSNGGKSSATKKQRPGAILPALPQHLSRQKLLDRMKPSETVILTCGNSRAMEDIKYIAEQRHIAFQMEEW